MTEKNINKIVTKDILMYVCSNCGINVKKRYRSDTFDINGPLLCEKCKMKNTNLRRYGVDCPSKSLLIRDKIKKNNIEKYGVEYPIQLEHVKEKRKKNNIRKYGADNVMKIERFKSRFKKTCLEKYGVDNPNKCIEVLNKRKKTNLKKYGCEHGLSSEVVKQKSKKTCLEKYGVDNIMQVPEIKEKLLKKLLSKETQQKMYLTKKKNKSFNKSSMEDKAYKHLLKTYDKVIRQYKDKRYPFACDFYIPKEDLFIECNFHWTHGERAYNSSREEDLLKVKSWESKSTKFYENAIKTWTVRDIKKRAIVNENKLNYLEFFNKEEFYSWSANC